MYDEYEYPKNLLNHTIGYSTSLKGGERNKTSKYPNPKSKIEKNIYCFFGVSWYQYQYQGTYTGYWVLGTGVVHHTQQVIIQGTGLLQYSSDTRSHIYK